MVGSISIVVDNPTEYIPSLLFLKKDTLGNTCTRSARIAGRILQSPLFKAFPLRPAKILSHCPHGSTKNSFDAKTVFRDSHRVHELIARPSVKMYHIAGTWTTQPLCSMPEQIRTNPLVLEVP